MEPVRAGFSRDGLGGVGVIDCNQGLLQFEEETCEQNVRCDGLAPGNGLSKGGREPQQWQLHQEINFKT